MLRRNANWITDIYLELRQNNVIVHCFCPESHTPSTVQIGLADQFTALSFLSILMSILKSDYEVSFSSGRDKNVLEIISHQHWRALKKPERPRLIEIMVHTGRRFFDITFLRGEKRPIYSRGIEFPRSNDLERVLPFLDDILEENSSSATNNINHIVQFVKKRTLAKMRILYALYSSRTM